MPRMLIDRKTVLPERSRSDMAEKYNRSGKFLNFASRCNKSPFVREYLQQKQNDICPVCGQPLYYGRLKLNVHHTSYDRECRTAETVKVLCTVNRKNGLQKEYCTVAPCAECAETHPDEFEQCMSKLIIIHGGCHARIHGIKTHKKKV